MYQFVFDVSFSTNPGLCVDSCSNHIILKVTPAHQYRRILRPEKHIVHILEDAFHNFKKGHYEIGADHEAQSGFASEAPDIQ